MVLQHEFTKKQLIKYADDNVILNFGTTIDKSNAKLEQNANKLIQYFHDY